MTVAVGFNPRFAAPPNPRRVATVERSCLGTHSCVATRRGRIGALNRGMNPTATVESSLRDAAPVFANVRSLFRFIGTNAFTIRFSCGAREQRRRRGATS